MLAVALLVGLVVQPWTRTKVTDLVVDLGQTGSGTLRDALAEALGDPTLEVGYWLGERYVDGAGRPLVLPDAESNRRVTRVNRDGEAIAVLVHDAAVLDDPGLSDALARAARLAAANARLQAEVQVQVDELGESRRRLVHAGDEERRRLERRLHETVERRLAELAGTLEHAQPGDDGRRTAPSASRSSSIVRSTSCTIWPPGFIRAESSPAALSAALAALAERSPLPVDLRITEVRRGRGARAGHLVRLLRGARERDQALGRLERHDLGGRAGGKVARRGQRRPA